MAKKKHITLCDRMRTLRNKILLNLGFIFYNTTGKNWVVKRDGKQLKSNPFKKGNYSMDDYDWMVIGHKYFNMSIVEDIEWENQLRSEGRWNASK